MRKKSLDCLASPGRGVVVGWSGQTALGGEEQQAREQAPHCNCSSFPSTALPVTLRQPTRVVARVDRLAGQTVDALWFPGRSSTPCFPSIFVPPPSFTCHSFLRPHAPVCSFPWCSLSVDALIEPPESSPVSTAAAIDLPSPPLPPPGSHHLICICYCHFLPCEAFGKDE